MSAISHASHGILKRRWRDDPLTLLSFGAFSVPNAIYSGDTSLKYLAIQSPFLFFARSRNRRIRDNVGPRRRFKSLIPGNSLKATARWKSAGDRMAEQSRERRTRANGVWYIGVNIWIVPRSGNLWNFAKNNSRRGSLEFHCEYCALRPRQPTCNERFSLWLANDAS